MWQIGQRIQSGKYEILAELGQGGFGVTYKALQVSLGREVVIKTLNGKLRRDPNAEKHVKRFRREARQLARLPESPHRESITSCMSEIYLNPKIKDCS